MASLMNGLSAAGSGLASFAATAGLEAQKADAATALQASGGVIQGNLQQQKFGLEAELAKQADAMLTVRGTNTAATLAATNATAASTLATTQADAAAKEQAAQLLRTQTTATADTPEIKNAKFRANATPEERQAQEEIMPGRTRYTYLPVTKPDPEDPTKVVSGIMKLDTHGVDAPGFIQTDTNPNKPGAAGGALGARSEVYLNRVMAAGNEAAQAAQNLMELPTTASRGYFGGRQQGTSLLGAAKESLVNSLTSQEVQDYNTLMAGVTRNLAAIETAGLAPSGSLTHSMDALTIKEGDTDLTRMRKMAELRQIVEKGLEPNLANPRISVPEKDKIGGIIGQIATAIPFTHHDITLLQQSNDPKMTMADLVKTKGLAGAAPVAPTPARDVYSGTGAEGIRETPSTPPAPPVAAIPAWVKPGDQYSPSRGQARGADGKTYGPQ